MSILGISGPTETEHVVAETAKSSLRTEVAKRIALGASGSVGAAIVFAAFELLHNDSKDAFPLLKSWGPWAIVSIIGVYVFYDLAKMLLNIGLRGVIAMEQSAVAATKLADKSDRQMQELQTLTSYCSQESERQSESIKELAATLADRGQVMDTILAIVQKQPAAVDVRKLVADTITEYKRAEAQGA